MKTMVLSASLLLSVGLLSTSAGQPDHRFDGVWVGTETVMMVDRPAFGGGPSDSYAKTHSAKIAIAEGGTMLAVIDGFYTGRYMEIHRSGNILVIHGENKNKGKSWGSELSLSADGKTLTEKGSIPAWAKGNAGMRQDAFAPSAPIYDMGGINTKVTGTFHRQK